LTFGVMSQHVDNPSRGMFKQEQKHFNEEIRFL
jgi:hypothetical protein